MLKPSMQELLGKVGNRYLLVNLAAQRARDISDDAEEMGGGLDDKPVKLALDEIADGTIVYRHGLRANPSTAEVSAAEFAEMFEKDTGHDVGNAQAKLIEDEGK